MSKKSRTSKNGRANKNAEITGKQAYEMVCAADATIGRILEQAKEPQDKPHTVRLSERDIMAICRGLTIRGRQLLAARPRNCGNTDGRLLDMLQDCHLQEELQALIPGVDVLRDLESWEKP